MTLKDLLQTAKKGFRFYVELATDYPSGGLHWMACLTGVRRMALDSIDLFDETVGEDEIAEACDILDDTYDQARKKINDIYRKAMNSDE